MIGALVLAAVVATSPSACPSGLWAAPTDEGYVCLAVSSSQQQVEHPKPAAPPAAHSPKRHHVKRHHPVKHHRKAHR